MSEDSAWDNAFNFSELFNKEDALENGYTCVPVTVSEKGEADELLREAKQHEGRGDDCGRLARLVISYLSRRQG